MRVRRLSIAAVGLLAASTLIAPTPVQAASPPDCLTVPGKAGSALTATVGARPSEAPDAYRTVNGKQEPVYRVSVGDVLHVSTRLANTGTCHYWTFGGDFTTLGADVFATPGSSTYVTGIGNRTWAAAIGVPTWDPDPNRDHPYTRRSERLYVQIYPGNTAKRLWPVTIDNLPQPNTYYEVQFRYDGTVSDPPLASMATSGRIWLIRD